MSQGIALPTPFPPICITPSAPVVTLVDDASLTEYDPDLPAQSVIRQTVCVTGLDDTNGALGEAIVAAMAAYPSPTWLTGLGLTGTSCMVVVKIEPTIGIDGIRRQSMIAGRGVTDDNGTTGTAAVFRLVYGYPSNLGGATSYEFLSGGITYDENPLDELESTGQIIVQVKGPTSSASAKAQAVGMFPTHPNNSSLGILKSIVRYGGGGTCASVWTVTLTYGCAKATAYGIVGNAARINSADSTKSTASLTIRARGQSSVSSALAEAISANPSHPNVSGLPVDGWNATARNNACDGLLTDVTIDYGISSGGTNTGSTTTLIAEAQDSMRTISDVPYQLDDFINGDFPTLSTSQDSYPVKGPASEIGQQQHFSFQCPIVIFSIPYTSNSSLVPWGSDLNATVNSGGFSIGGFEIPSYCGLHKGVQEQVFTSATGNIFKGRVVIHYCKYGYCTGGIATDAAQNTDGSFPLTVTPDGTPTGWTAPPIT